MNWPAFSTEQIYWLFSSFAQGVCALAGLLLAAFAIVQSLMERMKEQDESLDEILETIQRNLYVKLRGVAILSLAGILSSFFALASNNQVTTLNPKVVTLVFVTNIMAITCGMAFVLAVIDPQKYKRTAQRLVEKEEKTTSTLHEQARVGEFLARFNVLERCLREQFGLKIETLPSDMRPSRLPSLRQVVEALHRHEELPPNVHLEIIEVLRFRNLLVHGEESSCDRVWIDRIDRIVAQVKQA